VTPLVSASFHKGEDYIVRPLTEYDVTEEYVGWLNDPETTRYLTRPAAMATIARQRRYIRTIARSSGDAIFGLFAARHRLVGTSGVQRLPPDPYGPWLGVLIGPRECRGLGLGTALIWTVAHVLFTHFGVPAVYAGIQQSNVGSRRAFFKAGWREVRRVPGHAGPPDGGLVVCCACSDLVPADALGLRDLYVEMVPALHRDQRGGRR
jgi:RimJ/RimL family protein N-acetyltransferase